MERNYYGSLIEEMRHENPFISSKDIAYKLILDDILSRKIKSGDKIIQDNLSVLFGMSRSPIREALNCLEKEGFIEKQEKNGYRVHTMRLKDYVDYCEIRMLLESYAAQLAARNTTEEMLARLKDNLNRYSENMMDVDLIRNLDNEFHNIIIEASANRYIIEFNEKNAKRKDFYIRFLLQEKNMIHAQSKHTVIYEAIKNNDEKAAKEAMESHLKYYIKDLYDIM